MPLPAVVIGGYLGAGKTTLVNHLLRHADGRRIAVLVNDFGEVAIDADLIEAQDDEVLVLSGGCVCCSFGADLVGTLQRIAQRDPAPDLILIETSGVGLPAAVARTARLAPGIQIEGIVVLVDAQDGIERGADRYVGDTVTRQLQEAELIVLSKTDCVDDDRIAKTRSWLSQTAPQAPVIVAIDQQVPPDAILGLRIEGPRPSTWQPLRPLAQTLESAANLFVSQSIAVPRAIDVKALGEALSQPQSGVIRAKGILTDLDGQRCVLHVVGPRWSRVAAQPKATEAPDRLVIISLRGQLARSVETEIQRCSER